MDKKKEKQMDLVPPSKIQQRDIAKERERVEFVREQKKELKRKNKRAVEEERSKRIEKANEEESILFHKIFDYIKSNQDKTTLPNFKVIRHDEPIKKENGFIHLSISNPIFPKTKDEENISESEKEIARTYLHLDKKVSLTMDCLALYWFRLSYDLDFMEGFMGTGMGFTRLIGGIKQETVKTWKYKMTPRSQKELDLDNSWGGVGVSQFWEDSSYSYHYFDNHKIEFNINQIDYTWHYPWYFTIFDEFIEEAGKNLWKDFIERNLEW